jgi:hypothetical protein
VNVIIRKCAAVCQLLFEYKMLLVNGFMETGDDYLSSLISTKTKNKVESGLHVNVIIRKCAAVY